MFDEFMNGDSEACDQERKYFLSVLSTFQSYRKQSLLRIERNEQCLETLPDTHKQWLTKYYENLKSFKKCIEKNSNMIKLFLQDAHNMFDNMKNDNPKNASGEIDGNVCTLAEGMDKVQSVFKQLMRDWSSHGAPERAQCYQPIIDEILQQFPPITCPESEKPTVDRSQVQILVPGAGLGRLAFEIARLGFNCQGNEFNLYMLIASYFVLNRCQSVDQYEVYPWIHQYCNNLRGEDQTTGVRFPDVRPTPPSSDNVSFSMCAGDFLEVYQEENYWHCVATCFFIDCAANVVQFIETIHRILVPGGVWINLGPLLYHYSDMKNEKSIEPSFEVICEVIRQVGFTIEKSETGIKTRYCQNPRSMLQYEYDSVFFVCRKTRTQNMEECENSSEIMAL